MIGIHRNFGENGQYAKKKILSKKWINSSSYEVLDKHLPHQGDTLERFR